MSLAIGIGVLLLGGWVLDSPDDQPDQTKQGTNQGTDQGTNQGPSQGTTPGTQTPGRQPAVPGQPKSLPAPWDDAGPARQRRKNAADGRHANPACADGFRLGGGAVWNAGAANSSPDE